MEEELPDWSIHLTYLMANVSTKSLKMDYEIEINKFGHLVVILLAGRTPLPHLAFMIDFLSGPTTAGADGLVC